MTRLIPLVSVMAFACTSTHDFATGRNRMGGGIYSEELKPGFHYIVVKSNVGPMLNESGVAELWRKRAGSNCGASGFLEVQVMETVDEDMPPQILRYLHTVRKGYALCADSPVSEVEARSIAKANNW